MAQFSQVGMVNPNGPTIRQQFAQGVQVVYIWIVDLVKLQGCL